MPASLRPPTRAAAALSASLLALALATAAQAAPVDDAVASLQHDWDVIRYQTPPEERERRFQALAATAHQVAASFPGRAEPLVWEGIVVSSWAGEKGGLGALGLAKQAKALYERAIGIDGDALDGSAYGSLGVLYYKVPGWPIGFGDNTRAAQLLQKALTISPQGVDANYFYAEYLVETGRAGEAAGYLRRAIDAPARAGRQIADAGRKQEARALLAKIATH